MAPTQFDDEEDSLTWRLTSNGKFSVSSAYHAQLLGHIPSVIFPQVWRTKATPKCRLHAWLFMHNKALTADNLAKRGWPHDPICKLCHIQPETAVHIAATCSYSRQVWQDVLGKLSLPSGLAPDPSCRYLQDWWQHCSRSVPANIADTWHSLALLSWRILWKERNNRVFNNKAISAHTIADNIVTELNHWRVAGVLGASRLTGD